MEAEREGRPPRAQASKGSIMARKWLVFLSIFAPLAKKKKILYLNKCGVDQSKVAQEAEWVAADPSGSNPAWF